MSFQEDSVIFKQKLYQNFKQAGLLNRVQTTLRANLLQKLQKPSLTELTQKQTSQKEQLKKPFHLRQKFLTNVIYNFLEKKKMQYTISIFMPESNLSQKDCLTFNMLSDIANFPYHENEVGEKSFLECLIDEWVSKNSADKRQRAIQTQIQGQPVSKKLQNIEKDYLAKIDYWKLIPNKQVEQNSSFLQHEQKLKAKFQIEKQRLKMDVERVVKAQMERKFQNQYQFRLNQITKQHEKRIHQLKFRQKQILQSLEKKKFELQQKAKQLSTKQFQLIEKYQGRQKQIQSYYKKRQLDVEKRQKDFWKKELQLKAKKRQYQDTMRLVKQKAIGQAGQMPNLPNYSHGETFYH